MIQVVCCERYMKPLKNGVWFLERLKDGSPYQLWHTDKMVCEVCNKTVLAGFSAKALQPWTLPNKMTMEDYITRCRAIGDEVVEERI